MDSIVWTFEVDGKNFEHAGSASQVTKARLKQMGLPNDVVRRVIIAMYEGEITPDGKFSIEATRCIGCCGLAPVLTVNGEVYGKVTVAQVEGIINKYKK